MTKIVVASGYFDPIHVGHIECLEKAKKLGEKLVVIINNDIQAKIKKGKSFMSQEDRMKIVSSLRCVDEVFLSIDEDKSVVSFLKEGVKIDLGAIAKGYAVDRAIRKIRELRVKSCLIDAGGDIYCLGNKEGDLWQVGIRHPRKKNEIMDIIKLESKAVATSGDYEQMFILNDKRYSHIIDPKTGYPADKGIISVTVIAPYCLTADALATSIFVLGKNKGMDLVNYYGNSEALIYNEEDIDAYDIF